MRCRKADSLRKATGAKPYQARGHDRQPYGDGDGSRDISRSVRQSARLLLRTANLKPCLFDLCVLTASDGQDARLCDGSIGNIGGLGATINVGRGGGEVMILGKEKSGDLMSRE